jgi:hypothetical protein
MTQVPATSRFVLLALALAACESGVDTPALDLPEPVPVDVAAAAGASLPHIDGSEHGLLLSWVEPADSGHALHFARWDDGAFGTPRAVAAGRDWFVNWADFPSVVDLGGGRLAAHWLQRSGPGTYAYDVVISRSDDGGTTWQPAFRPHTDATATEHGFVSLFPHGGDLGAVWLDGRRFAEGTATPATNEMTVRFTAMPQSAPGADQQIDDRACDCCQTAVALTARGPLLAYRDRTAGEVRDISVTRLENGQWAPPRVLHADDWVIDACPVNGPQADAIGERVAIAWFTAARDTPRVNVIMSNDAGDTFGAPVRVDGGNPIGRVDVVLLDEQRALVVWLERTGDGAEVQARVVDNAGNAGATRALGSTMAQRPSGFPRMGRHGSDVIIAWTQPGESTRVRAARLAFDP